MPQDDSTPVWLKAVQAFGPYVAALVAWCALSSQKEQFSQQLTQQQQQFDQRFEKDRQDTANLRRSELEQRAKDFKLKYYEQQLAVYTDVCDSASKIAYSFLKGDSQPGWTRFKNLVLGKLSLFSDEAVYKAALVFGNRYNSLRLNERVPREEMWELATQLSNACSESLSRAFEIPVQVGALTKMKEEARRW